MQFGAIIIGDEILSGKRQDKHMAKAIATLGARSVGLNPSLHALTASVTRSIRAIRRMMSSCGLPGSVNRAATVFRQSVLFGNGLAGPFRCGRSRAVPCWGWEGTLMPVPRCDPRGAPSP